MPDGGALVALLLVASVAGTVALWYAIDSETDENPRMDRSDAERAVRQDTDERGENDDRTADDDGDWGTDAEWGVDDRE